MMSVAVMRKRVKRAAGIVLHLPADDPRSVHHPSQRERLLEFAEMLGRLEAREDFARMKAAQREPKTESNK
jgi:hypothetical protein